MSFLPARSKASWGLTLVELLVVLALIGALALASTPYLLGTLEKQRLVKERDKVVGALKQAQQKSRVAQSGESYGLSFANPAFYLSLPDNKQVFYEHNVTVNSSANLVFFRKLTGQLDLTPPSDELIITVQSNNFSTQITVNSYGVLNTSTPERF